MADAVIRSRWQISDESAPPAGRRTVTSVADPHLSSLVGDRFEAVHTFRATSPQRRGAEPLLPLDVTVPAEPSAAYLLAVRQEGSGALSFHRPTSPAGRRDTVTARLVVTFEVTFPDAPDEPTRRSIISKAIKCVVFKLLGAFADIAVPWVGSKVEDLIWRTKHLPQGWLQVTQQSLAAGQLDVADFSRITAASDRCLLLLHGTFSNTAGGFHDLATTSTAAGQNFLSSVAPLYGNRIYAFNHFTVSKTPEENARELIAGLPVAATFDVITHSRGGLVLRNLVERAAGLGAQAGHFTLGKAILVASPNQGTPLATADRFDTLISWWSNVLELFPENPFTTTADYILEGLTFIARHVVDALPGLESMDTSGGQITTLNGLPHPPANAYSAIASNYQPTGHLLARIFDLGVDSIFGMANDLVVPTEGAWKTDDHPAWVNTGQILCFGTNITSATATDVIHTTYFAQPEAVDFLIKTLSGQALTTGHVDLDTRLPYLLRRGTAVSAAPGTVIVASPPSTFSASAVPDFGLAPLGEADDVLQLFLISSDEHLPQDAVKTSEIRTAILLATYRNARVVETIFLRGGPHASVAGSPDDIEYHWQKIIGIDEKIKGYVDGKTPALPGADELHELGVNLFNAMFPGTVRRLYDVARVDRARAGKRLDIVMTSMVNWVADKPWEFAYDPSRQSFLATEAVNFTRNVLTAVPADEFVSHLNRPLHILIVVAQPIGLGLLSVDQEKAKVGRGFQPLVDAGLATIEFMLHARIDDLHDRLRRPDVDVLHFIGHGEYRDDEKEGYLVFENPDGGMQRVSSESLRQVLCQRGIRLVFLNACETGVVGRTEDRVDFNRGVAPKLVAGGIPILVANQYKVLDVSATEFARAFYWWLALGSTVGDAAREARVAVNYTVTSENIDWAVPVVYARNPGRRIYTDDERQRVEAAFRPLAAKDVRTTPCRGFKGLKVGLWDVNHVLPELDAVAARFTDRQRQYCFQTVEVSAPLGTWRRTAPPGGGATKGYIIGDEVAAKLRDHVAGLGLDRLICITTFALADQQDTDLALWNEDPNQRISIISGELLFDQPDPAAANLNRFIANMVVSALSGFDEHETDPTDCPNHFSVEHASAEERLEYLTAKERFCQKCRDVLGDKAIPLENILSAY